MASCCKRIGIDGIKYRSTGYDCCVLWKDDYFEFVDGAERLFVAKLEIIRCKNVADIESWS